MLVLGLLLSAVSKIVTGITLADTAYVLVESTVESVVDDASRFCPPHLSVLVMAPPQVALPEVMAHEAFAVLFKPRCVNVLVVKPNVILQLLTYDRWNSPRLQSTSCCCHCC